jgi:mercuric ion binding protein
MSCFVYIEAGEQKVVMDIEGMTCKLCPLAIKKSLSEVDGVIKVKVFYKDRQAVLVIEETVHDETLIEAVEKAGSYTVNSIEREEKV